MNYTIENRFFDRLLVGYSPAATGFLTHTLETIFISSRLRNSLSSVPYER